MSSDSQQSNVRHEPFLDDVIPVVGDVIPCNVVVLVPFQVSLELSQETTKQILNAVVGYMSTNNR